MNVNTICLQRSPALITTPILKTCISTAYFIPLLGYLTRHFKCNMFKAQFWSSPTNVALSQFSHLSKWQLCPSWSHPWLLSFISQFSSVTQLCPTLCDPMNHTMPGLPVHHQIPDFTQTHVHWVSDAIQPFHPLPSPSPPAPNPSQHQGLFQWVNFSHEVAKVLEFQLQHQSFQWTPRTFRMDWLDLLAVQGTLKSPLQHHSSKASILWCLAFFTVQLSHPYMTTGKTIALWSQVGLRKHHYKQS